MLFYIMLALISLLVSALAVGLTRSVRSWGHSGETAISQPFTARKAKPMKKVATATRKGERSRNPDFEFGDWGMASANRPARRLAAAGQGGIRKPWGW